MTTSAKITCVPGQNPRWTAWLETKPAKIRNIEFMAWIREQWAAFDQAYGYRADRARSDEEHAEFDRWLGIEDA